MPAFTRAILSLPRRAARGAALRVRAWQRPTRLVVGAGQLPQAGWINTDRADLDVLRERDWRAYFRPGGVDAILAEHVWEHLTPAEGLLAARLCHKFLRPGGYLRLAVPDGWHVDPEYLATVRPGGSGPGADDHRVLYHLDSLSRLLGEAGFAAIEPLEYFDRQGVFHALPWRPEDGRVERSLRFDDRNRDGAPHYTSLIVDARKAR